VSLEYATPEPDRIAGRPLSSSLLIPFNMNQLATATADEGRPGTS